MNHLPTATATPVFSELGQASHYDAAYNPERLFPIARSLQRDALGIVASQLPFYGFDCWNHYEVSWLNEKGKPMVAIAEIIYDCATPNLIESKSLKLYFNSFNNSQFNTQETLAKIIQHDISTRVGGEVSVKIRALSDAALVNIQSAPKGDCIDELDVACNEYTVAPHFLKTGVQKVEEVLYSDLLKSNCLVTNQPDWGTVQIAYYGHAIDRAGLLQYLVSFRNHNEFHEQCIERIFVDILRYCKPEMLTVYGRYTRRGGLDINPYRSTQAVCPEGLNGRLIRQ